MKPGPKGPSQEVIAAVVDMKQRNPSWGSPRIAQQISLAFGLSINKDVVRGILAARYQPKPDSAGPSWLTVLGHAKDSLWSLDLFRCESASFRNQCLIAAQCPTATRVAGYQAWRRLGRWVRRGETGIVILAPITRRRTGRRGR
jgi:hypothetical protein